MPVLVCKVSEPELDRLQKLKKVFIHFNYAERYGLTFKDYVRKVDAGTWGELAE